MQTNFQLTIEQENTVRSILRKHLTAKIRVWVFGSRAKNSAKSFSDLDLALEDVNGKKIPGSTILNLEQDFENSTLPWKVELVDLNDLTANFLNIVEADKKLFNVEITNE